jgi:hypothetical protein
MALRANSHITHTNRSTMQICTTIQSLPGQDYFNPPARIISTPGPEGRGRGSRG